MKIKDQLGEIIVLEQAPKRIISLVPSITELLHELGLDQETVGITKFCIHPNTWHQTKTRVGGTKQVDFKIVKFLNPDFIIANKEENTKEDIAQLKTIAPVYVSDINTLEECYLFLKDMGEIFHLESELSSLSTKIKENLALVTNCFQQKTVLYFIWDDPMFLAGKNTFIDAMLTHVGLNNVCLTERYPALDLEKMDSPDFIFLSSEPFPFQEKHIEKYQNLFPNSKICLVDGEMFSWYGSHLLQFTNYIKALNQLIS
jgi:ABC-type Fe3+-hydroxamate transport system substrate-binding protein